MLPIQLIDAEHESAEASQREGGSDPPILVGQLDCFVAEPVIGGAFARPVGSLQ